MILGVDPGREKVGLAVVNGDQIVWRKVIAPHDLATEITGIVARFSIEKIALGDSTASEFARDQIERSAPGISLQIVDEKNSTLEARSLYFAIHPPRGLRKLVPLSLQTPSVSIDDFAAAVIARRSMR